MKNIEFETFADMATKMIEQSEKADDVCVDAVCHFSSASRLTEELIKQGCHISWIDIHDYNYSNYQYEFIVSLMDHQLIVEPAYKYKKNGYKQDGYVNLGSDIVFVHGDCDCQLIKFIDTDKVYRFSVLDRQVDETSDELQVFCSNSVTVSKTHNGVPTGFTKTWLTSDEKDVETHSTYSVYTNDVALLKQLAKKFDVIL